MGLVGFIYLACGGQDTVTTLTNGQQKPRNFEMRRVFVRDLLDDFHAD